MTLWKAPKPRKGGSQKHKCDDAGKTYVANGRLYTCCSQCDKIVAIDPYEET
jgi:hypothetical protein